MLGKVRLYWDNVPDVALFLYRWSRFVNSDFSVTIIWLPYCSLHLGYVYTAEHNLSRMVSPCHALSRITLYSRVLPVYRVYDHY
jgi:hypothetical protein